MVKVTVCGITKEYKDGITYREVSGESGGGRFFPI